MAGLGEFSVRIAKRAKGVEVNTNNAIKRLALAIDQAVVLETPVDIGRARSNWTVALGSPHTGQRAPYAPGDHLGKGEGSNAAGAIQQAQQEILGRKPQQTIFISNNVDYIGILNSSETRSAQSPPFFVQGAIRAALAEFRRTKVII